MIFVVHWSMHDWSSGAKGFRRIEAAWRFIVRTAEEHGYTMIGSGLGARQADAACEFLAEHGHEFEVYELTFEEEDEPTS